MLRESLPPVVHPLVLHEKTPGLFVFPGVLKHFFAPAPPTGLNARSQHKEASLGIFFKPPSASPLLFLLIVGWESDFRRVWPFSSGETTLSVTPIATALCFPLKDSTPPPDDAQSPHVRCDFAGQHQSWRSPEFSNFLVAVPFLCLLLSSLSCQLSLDLELLAL